MIDTMLQYYLGIPEPEKLSNQDWAIKFAQLEEIRKKEQEKTERQFNY